MKIALTTASAVATSARSGLSLNHASLDVDLRRHLRRAASCFGHYSGLSRVIRTRYRGRGMIFVLHSVVDDDAVYVDQTLRCSTRQLETTLKWLRGQDVDFVGLDEAVLRLQDSDLATVCLLHFGRWLRRQFDPRAPGHGKAWRAFHCLRYDGHGHPRDRRMVGRAGRPRV